MKQGNREQPPTDDQHSASHLPGPAVDNQVDDKRKTESRSNDHRSTNDSAPVELARVEDYARIRLVHRFVIFYRYLLSTPIAGSRSEIDPCSVKLRAL